MKRVFSNNENVNYIDYIKNKQGIEIIKTTISKNKNLDYFFNYNDFILLTKVYFKYNKLDDCNLVNLTSIYDANQSFVVYNQVSTHIKTCECCKNSRDLSDLNLCEEIKNILYPLGKIINNKKDTIYFPKKLNLNNWCKKCSDRNKSECIPRIQHPCEDKCKKEKCKPCGKYGMCNNTKPLFI